MFGALILPGAIALVLGAGLEGDTRRRRQRRLVQLGAGRAQLTVLELAEVAAPIVAGSAVVGIGARLLLARTVRVPSLDFELARGDAHRAVTGAGVALLLSLIASLCVGNRGGGEPGH